MLRDRTSAATGGQNYVDRVVAELEGVLDDCDIDLLRYYALLVLVLGPETTEEDTHNAWALWRTATRPNHKSLVPFEGLAPDVQALETKYAEAIRAVAGKTGGTR